MIHKRKISNIIQSFKTSETNDIYMLLEEVTRQTKTHLFANPDITLTQAQYTEFVKYLNRLDKKEPLAYILGYKHFYDSKFLVNKHTLIPRPETELLVEEVLREISRAKESTLNILEIGTGSGCITISILKAISNKSDDSTPLNFVATDISFKALEIAKKNATEILPSRTKNMLKFKKADVLPKTENQIFDIIISNPPYITSSEYQELDHSVKDYEPQIALTGGESGLEIFERILQKTQKNTAPGTKFFFEINPTTRQALKRLINKYYPRTKMKFIKDQYKTYRFVEFIV